jgi:hypothetical protein
MQIFRNCIVFTVLVLQSSLCYSQYLANIIVVPDPQYNAHQFGVEMAVTQKNRLGILAAYKRDSERLAGVENDKFKSVSGSRAEVTFVNLGLLAGYQWFWRNGFNISAMVGGALLIENSSVKNISANEKSDVTEYLNKNTKTNNHVAAGIVFGWAF